MDKDLKKYYQKQMEEIKYQIGGCDYTDNYQLVTIIDKLADMVQSILHEL